MDPKRIIFVDKNGTSRAPMAAGIFKDINPGFSGDVLARGIFASFPEPINPKAEAVLTSNGIDIAGYSAKKLDNSEIIEGTVIFTLEESLRGVITERYEASTPENTYGLSSFAGEELEIMNPHAGSLQSYGLCFESMKNVIKKVIDILEEDNE